MLSLRALYAPARGGSAQREAAASAALPPILPADGSLARYLCAADSSWYESPPTA